MSTGSQFPHWCPLNMTAWGETCGAHKIMVTRGTHRNGFRTGYCYPSLVFAPLDDSTRGFHDAWWSKKDPNVGTNSSISKARN